MWLGGLEVHLRSKMKVYPDNGSTLPDEALASDIAILGKKGRGKSYAAKGLVERLLDLGERVLILDPSAIGGGEVVG